MCTMHMYMIDLPHSLYSDLTVVSGVVHYSIYYYYYFLYSQTIYHGQMRNTRGPINLRSDDLWLVGPEIIV